MSPPPLNNPVVSDHVTQAILEFLKYEQNAEFSVESRKKKVPVKSNIKKELTNAGYRVAATQGLKLSQNAMVALLAKAGFVGEAAGEMLSTEMGRSILSMALGFGIEYIPNRSERTGRIAQEFRITSMTIIGNEIVSTVLEAALGVMSSMAAADAPIAEIKEERVDTLHYPTELVVDSGTQLKKQA